MAQTEVDHVALGTDVASSVSLARTRMVESADTAIHAEASTMNTTIAIYRTGEGWRWQMRDARNGRIIGAATEGYSSRKACLANISRVVGHEIVVKSRNRDNRYTRTVSLGPRAWSYTTEFRR
jgi:uncharacterized protein YegP (UPF0339 family)